MAQSLSNVLVHTVFSTRERIPMIPPHLQPQLHSYLAGVLKHHGCQPLKVGGVDDHVHLLYALSRTITMADLLEQLKKGF